MYILKVPVTHYRVEINSTVVVTANLAITLKTYKYLRNKIVL